MKLKAMSLSYVCCTLENVDPFVRRKLLFDDPQEFYTKDYMNIYSDRECKMLYHKVGDNISYEYPLRGDDTHNSVRHLRIKYKRQLERIFLVKNILGNITVDISIFKMYMLNRLVYKIKPVKIVLVKTPNGRLAQNGREVDDKPVYRYRII